MKETIVTKAGFKEMFEFSPEDNEIPYNYIKNQTRKVVARTMKKETGPELNNLYQNSNSVFSFPRRMKEVGKGLEGGRCLSGRKGRLGFIGGRQGENLEGRYGKVHE